MSQTKTKTILLFLLFALVPCSALGVVKTITIAWSMADTTDVTGYRIYYSYDSSMTNKQLACETSDPAATSLTCSNVDLAQSTVYFSVAAVLGDQESSSSPMEKTIFSTISPVQGFQLEVSGGTTPPSSGTVLLAINFQPADVPVPDGFVVDSGLSFDASRGYGWVTGPDSLGLRDRDSTYSASQEYDTLVHVAPTSAWEATVPNGTYTVTICDGDASWPQGTQNVQAESVSVIDNVTLSSSTRWVEKSATVTVNDGRLTVTFNGSTDPARLCWLKIESAN